MSYEMQTPPHMGSHPFNHPQSSSAEQEYDRLRSLARQEAAARSSAFDRSKAAYSRGDGAAAHALSEQGKEHGAAMAAYNKQASDYIFRENNAPGRVPPDTIDLHGQYVEEAQDILEQRIKYAQSSGQTHLHVIVGKGEHSPGHIQKIKPIVEEICQQLGLQYHTEPNEGRMYVNLSGGPVDMGYVNNYNAQNYSNQQNGYAGQAPQWQQQYGQGQAGYSGQQAGFNQPQAPNQSQHQGQNQSYTQNQNANQNNNQSEQMEKLAIKFLPRILNFLQRLLCK